MRCAPLIVIFLSQVIEAFPECSVKKEPDAEDFMVVIKIRGTEVWRIDSRESPILAIGTTDTAIEAITKFATTKAPKSAQCCTIS